jgi:hypothetical protein
MPSNFSSSLVLSNLSLPLVASAPFVNINWKTDLFTVQYLIHNPSDVRSYRERAKERLLDAGLSEESYSFKCMLDLAGRVDGLAILAIRPDVANGIGNGKNETTNGYQIPRDTLKDFVEAITAAIIVDRMVAATGKTTTGSFTQLLHPYSKDILHQHEMNVSEYRKLSTDMLLSLSSYQPDIFFLGQPGSINHESALKLSAANFALEANSSGIISNIFRISCIILHLCTVGRLQIFLRLPIDA